MSNSAASGRRPRLVVELVGIPGSGKSTLCAALIEELESAGIKSMSRQEMLHFHGPSAKSNAVSRHLRWLRDGNFDLVWYYLLALARVHSARPDGGLLRSVYSHIQSTSAIFCALKTPARLLILDEGLIQRTASIGVPHAESGQCYLNRALERVMLRLLETCEFRVIALQTKRAVAVQRGNIRSRDHNSAAPPAWYRHGRSEWIKRLEQSIHALLGVAVRANVPILLLDGGESVDQLKKRAAKWIHSTWNG